MQTFVPMGADFQANAEVLDMRRLGKQRVEGLQILYAITGAKSGWRNHPIVKMWDGYELALFEYVAAMCDAWTARGYKDTCRDKAESTILTLNKPLVMPSWLYDPEIALSHKSNLVRKLPEHYGALWPEVPYNLPYKWVI